MDALRLPIDPKTLEASLTSRKLRAIDVDGTLIYDEHDSSDNSLTERLGRIWDEYPNGLLDLTESKIAALDPAGLAVEEQDGEQEEEEAEIDRSKPMPYEDMQRLRDSLYDQLNTARNELWFALELAKTMSVSSDFTTDPPFHPNQPPSKKAKKPAAPNGSSSDVKAEPPILPAGSYTATPSAARHKSRQTQILEYEMALAAKHQALDECSALIDSAVEELQVMSDASDRFWKDIRQLKDGRGGKGRWAVVPKPDYTRAMAEGEKARDVMVPYAVDEAPSSVRARCLAAFDLDPTKEHPLSFGQRGYRRLRVTLQSDIRSTVSTLPRHDPDVSINEMMETAQLEALDEDLYNELQSDIARHPNGTVTTRSASLQMGSRTLTFEMCDTRVTPEVAAQPSAECEVIVLAARLSLLQQHRRRKTRLLGRTSSGNPILQPIVQLLQFQTACQAVESTLKMFTDTCGGSGIFSSVRTTYSAVDGSDRQIIEGILAGQAGVAETSVTYKLDLADCRGITVMVAASSACRVTTSIADFAVPDLAELSPVIADDLARQLLLSAQQGLAKHLGEIHRSDVFYDDLEGVVRVPGDSTLQVTIDAPYDGINASIEGSVIGRYQPDEDRSLGDWLETIATDVRDRLGS